MKPVDEDFNDYNKVFERIENDMIDADNITFTHPSQPKQAKGGVFAPADIALIKRALDVYKTQLVATEESERTTSLELIQLANLMHRLNNRI